jgi:hypothetical protein
MASEDGMLLGGSGHERGETRAGMDIEVNVNVVAAAVIDGR